MARSVSVGRGKTEWGLLLIGCSALSIAIAYNSYDYGVSLHITIRGVLVACYQYTVLGVMSFLRHAFTGQ